MRFGKCVTLRGGRVFISRIILDIHRVHYQGKANRPSQGDGIFEGIPAPLSRVTPQVQLASSYNIMAVLVGEPIGELRLGSANWIAHMRTSDEC